MDRERESTYVCRPEIGLAFWLDEMSQLWKMDRDVVCASIVSGFCGLERFSYKSNQISFYWRNKDGLTNMTWYIRTGISNTSCTHSRRTNDAFRVKYDNTKPNCRSVHKKMDLRMLAPRLVFGGVCAGRSWEMRMRVYGRNILLLIGLCRR